MNSKERVNAVLGGKTPDRPPIILGASNATSIKNKAYANLCNFTGIKNTDNYLYDWCELSTSLPSEKMLARLGSDVRGVFDRFPEKNVEANRNRPLHSNYVDDWGGELVEVEPGEWTPFIHPLKDIETVEELDSYTGWPDMSDPYRVENVRSAAEKIASEEKYSVFATPWLLFPFERACMLQGMDNFVMNMALRPDFAEHLLRKILELCKTLMASFLEQAGDKIEIIQIGDDLGTQENLIVSPGMYRELLKPIHKEFIEFIKSRTNAKVFFHTDGDVFDLIGDLIEIGVDILNPIQTSAGKMSDIKLLKEKFGDRLIFCGGIDTQKILPYGSPSDVRKEVKRVSEILGESGGYMVAPVHTIMNEVPPENILAMVDAVCE